MQLNDQEPSLRHTPLSARCSCEIVAVQMSEDEVAQILAQLVGPSDKQFIANLRNFQVLSPQGSPPATSARGEALLRLRSLKLMQKRPEHSDKPIFEAEHILTSKGLMIGQIINERCNVPLAFPNPNHSCGVCSSSNAEQQEMRT